jgi:F-type H+-transporting ATPase subunit alpha
VSAYIPTNVISITDGQIYLESGLFYSGVRPAVNPGISVSRVGGSAQIKAMKKVAGALRLNLAQYRELEAFAQFGTDLDKATQAQLARGARLVEILKQQQYKPLPIAYQVLIIHVASAGHLDSVAVNALARFEHGLFEYFDQQRQDLLEQLASGGDFTDDLRGRIDTVVQAFKERIWREGKHS